ncbi:hypothetical protein C8J57DRAFT_1581231, partial [Mycena rebaudengoi]
MSLKFLLFLACVCVAAEVRPSPNISHPGPPSLLAPVLPYFLSSSGPSRINGLLGTRQSCEGSESDCEVGCCAAGYEYSFYSTVMCLGAVPSECATHDEIPSDDFDCAKGGGGGGEGRGGVHDFILPSPFAEKDTSQDNRGGGTRNSSSLSIVASTPGGPSTGAASATTTTGIIFWFFVTIFNRGSQSGLRDRF